MEAEGPDENEIQIIEDSNGTQFQFSESQFLGRGVGGKVYRAKVVTVKSGTDNFEVGQEVALKSIISKNPSDPKFQRELEVQKREGTLYTTITQEKSDEGTKLTLVQPIFPGVDLRNALYLLKGGIRLELPVGKQPILNEEADAWLVKLDNDSVDGNDRKDIAEKIAGKMEFFMMQEINSNDKYKSLREKLDPDEPDRNLVYQELNTLCSEIYPKMSSKDRRSAIDNLLRLNALLKALTKEGSLTESEKNLVRRQINQNTAMTNEERNKIAYSLIRDYYAIQQLGIVHCDIKPDNILVDRQSGTAKIIDMGQAFLLQDLLKKPLPHEGFQGPGLMYSAPEGKDSVLNSSKTDIYGIGIVIASMYSQNAYEVKANDVVDATVEAHRAILSDVLEAEHVEGMPEDLRQIVQEITQVDPEDRPKNIALAKGIKNSAELSDIASFQREASVFAHKVLAEHNLTLQSKFPREIESLSGVEDVPTILQTLESMKSQSNSKSKMTKSLIIAIEKIQQHQDAHVRNFQQSKIQGHKKEEISSARHITLQLRTEAEEYRKRNKDRKSPFTLLAKQKSDYEAEGRMLQSAADKIEGVKDIDAIRTILSEICNKINDLPGNNPSRNRSLALISRLQESLPLKSAPSENQKKEFSPKQDI